MRFGCFAYWAATLFTALFSINAYGSVDWLIQQSQPDGSIATAADVATATQSTSEAAKTLRLLGRGSQIAAAEGFLNAQTYHGTEYLARTILASADAGGTPSSLITELNAHQNADGGFGEFSGYGSNVLDTAFALEALVASGQSSQSSVGNAVGYLLQTQKSDGSWADEAGNRDVYSTSIAARALHAFRAQYAAVPSSVANAGVFLLSRRGTNSLWADDVLTAQALLTLATISTDVAPLQSSRAAFESHRLTNHSWQNDVYITALALRALYVLDARGSGVIASPTGGLIAGYVLRAGSTEALAGVAVSVNSASETPVFTNSDGYFVLPGVPAGDRTLTITKTGYSAATRVVTVYSGQSTNAGQVFLAQSFQDALLRGRVFDSQNQQPLSQVMIALSGTGTATTTSTADGSFEVAGLAPGNYAVTFTRPGYYTITGTLSASAGSVTSAQQGLLREGAFLDESPATITGRVVDGSAGQALVGVQLALDGTPSAVTAADGTFTIANVTRGSHAMTLTAQGYGSANVSFVFPPGASGQLGDVELFAVTNSQGATTLTIVGTVKDGLDNHLLGGVSVVVNGTGQTLTTDARGRFVIAGLTTLEFELTLSTSGYQTRTYGGVASGYGEIAASFTLPPSGGDPVAASSTLKGFVRDSVTAAPIANASVQLAGTQLAATTTDDGSFEISGISTLEFSLVASATSYSSRDYSLELSQHGTYDMSIELDRKPAAIEDVFQIVSIVPVQTATGANTVQQFAARVSNLTAEQRSTLLIGMVIDATGATVATVNPYAIGTETPTPQLTFAASQTLEVIVPWNTAQFPPGSYRLVLRAVEPETINRDLPSGIVLAQAETIGTVTASKAIAGGIELDPPLTQAGTSQPVALSAIIINNGNVPLTGQRFTLTVRDPGNASVLYTTYASAESLEVSGTAALDFGAWTPTRTGNFPVEIVADDVTTTGKLQANLYVGDKATGEFTVDRSIVPLGTQTVRANIALQGVDVTTGVSTDPLFAAVKEAVRKGGLFVGPQAKQWANTNRCLGCHIQTQSFTGLAAAMDKAEIDPAHVRFLYNNIVGSQQADGGLRASDTATASTQTALGIWSLSNWKNAAQVFRTIYKGAVHQLNKMRTSGNQSWWDLNHCSVWVCHPEPHTMTSVKGLAATLRMATELGAQPIADYTFTDSGHNLVIPNVIDFEQGADGRVWYLDLNGVLYVRDLVSQQSQTLASGLPTPAYGIALRPDGTVYVAARSALIRVAPNGTRTTLLSGGSFGHLTEVAIGPDGLLYVADHSNSRILRVTEGGSSTVFASGGLLAGPHGLAFDAIGNLYVANNLPGNFRIVRITPQGVVSTFADGFPYQLTSLRLAPDGYFYAMSVEYSNLGVTPPGVWRIDTNGYAERLPMFNSYGAVTYNALGVVNGDIHVHHAASRHLYKLNKIALNPAQLQAMRDAMPRIARYFLARYNDNPPYNDLMAVRLVSLGEVRPYLTDPALAAQVDDAMTYIANLLRSRQRADGGWTYVVNSGSSDPFTTAFVGLALEYTNPSVNDPVVRNAIQFLLSKQQPDFSWPFNTGVFTTHLGPSSFVMAYLPVALERLGGIDTDLNVTVPANVVLTNPSLAPTSQTPNGNGSVTYQWSLRGVTANTRNVAFDVTLQNLGYQEQRPVATEAYLGFKNSFTAEVLRSNLTIPKVRAVSDLALTVSTGQASYGANGDVSIVSVIRNIGPAAYGQVELSIRTADGAIVTSLGTSSFGSIASGAESTLTSTWNTGALLAGSYQVYGRLLGPAGVLIGETIAPFSIVHAGASAVITASIVSDRPTYEAWDSVVITSRVRNTSANVIQPTSLAELTVRSPADQVLLFTTFSVSELQPGGLRDLTAELALIDRASGAYGVELVVKDAFTRATLATAGGSFNVERRPIQAVSGNVKVANVQVYKGDPNLCTDTVRNLSSSALANVVVTRTLVNLDTGVVVESINQTVNFAANQSHVLFHNLTTSALPLGTYACLLSAVVEGATKQVGQAAFDVIAPPIRVDGDLALGRHGRVLVLVDAPASLTNAADPFGPTTAPDLHIQKAHIESVLQESGWSYTLVENAFDFEREFNTAGYEVVVIYAEVVKISEALQDQIVAAVGKGLGLLVAGNHDSRNGRLETALGIKSLGKSLDASALALSNSEVIGPGEEAFPVITPPNAIKLETATSIAQYVLLKTKAGQGPEPAVTLNRYGQGKAIYAGFDLPLEGAAAGDDSLFGQLFAKSLEFLHPAVLTPYGKRVVPIELTLNNLGIATSGRVIVTLPAGATAIDVGTGTKQPDGTVLFTFSLAQNASTTLPFWVRVPEIVGDVAVNANVQVGTEGHYQDHSNSTLTIRVEVRP